MRTDLRIAGCVKLHYSAGVQPKRRGTQQQQQKQRQIIAKHDSHREWYGRWDEIRLNGWKTWPEVRKHDSNLVNSGEI